MLLEQEEKYLWIAFSVLGVMIIFVIGLSYYFWKRRRIKATIKRHLDEMQSTNNNPSAKKKNTSDRPTSNKYKRKESQASLKSTKNTNLPKGSENNEHAQSEQKNIPLQQNHAIETVSKTETIYDKERLDFETTLPSIGSNISLDSLRQYARLPGRKSIPSTKY